MVNIELRGARRAPFFLRSGGEVFCSFGAGCSTTLDFCKWAIQHEAFRSGNFDTHFVKQYFKPEYLTQLDTAATSEGAEDLAAIIGAFATKGSQQTQITSVSTKTSQWKQRARV
jgi:acetyl-CoA carboxylase biotin carboxylase subunit